MALCNFLSIFRLTLFSMKILDHVDEYQHKHKSKTFSSLWSTSFVLHFRIKENYATSSSLNDSSTEELYLSSRTLLNPDQQGLQTRSEVFRFFHHHIQWIALPQIHQTLTKHQKYFVKSIIEGNYNHNETGPQTC